MKGDYLVGGSLTLADIFVAVALALPFQTVLDAGVRKGFAAAGDWSAKIYGLPELKSVLGQIRLCDKPLKPVTVADPKVEKPKKEEKKKEEKPAPKKEEKKLDNV